MKRTKLYADLLTAIMIVLIMLMVAEFLATTDIYHDYISKPALSGAPRKYINALPRWSDAIVEWKVVNFCFTSRIILFITALILSIGISRRNRETEPGI